jgi:hypothetical protein
MRKSRFTESQIVAILKEGAAGAPILTANPKVRVSVIWLPERSPLRTFNANTPARPWNPLHLASGVQRAP